MQSITFKVLNAALAVSLCFFACNKTTDPVVTPITASIAVLTCASTTYSAMATAATAYTGTATVPYTGGNGVAYSAGTAIASTGVTGLTATLAAGMLALGAGSATFAITGTPSAAGTATFSISLGGQSCSISLTVAAAPVTGGTGNKGLDITTDVSKLVVLAEAFKATLTATQLTTLQLAYSKADATKWSNLPQALSRNRVGLATSTLSATQLTAFRAL